MRTCTVCKESKEDEAFSIIRRNPDGSVKYRNSWCGPCKADKHREKHGVAKRRQKTVTEDGKECTRCWTFRPHADFSANVRNEDGSEKYTSSWCRICASEAALEKQGGRVKQVPQVFEESKECLGCKEIKHVSLFSPSARGRLGRSSYCKPCRSERVKATKAYKAGAGTESTRRYRERNPERHRALHRVVQFNRKARIKAQSDGTITDEVLKELYAKELCCWCAIYVPTADRTLEHIVELSQGGLHGISNIDMACRSCNSARKGRLNENI